MEIGLRHHVFSSEGGYKTMHVSPELRPMVKTLEAFAKRIYKKVTREPLYALLRPDGRLALSKTFVAGSDHVGRLRGCVHTILPELEGLQGSSLSNPFDLLDTLPFIGEGVNLLAVAGELTPSVEFAPETGPVVPRLDVAEKLAQAAFMGMLSPHHEAVAADPTGEIRSLVAALYPLLPPFIRGAFSALLGSYLPPAEDTTRFDFFILPGKADLKEFKGSGKLVIDVVHGELENVPASSPYCNMVMDACFGRSDGSALKNFLRLMEKNDFSGEPTWDVLRSLTEAFSHVARLTTEDGKVVTRADPAAVLKAVVPFARGGYAELAFRLLRESAAQAVSKSETQEVAPNLAQHVAAVETGMEELKKRPAVLFQRLGQLSEALARYFAQKRASGRKPPPDAEKRSDITDTMLSGDC